VIRAEAVTLESRAVFICNEVDTPSSIVTSISLSVNEYNVLLYDLRNRSNSFCKGSTCRITFLAADAIFTKHLKDSGWYDKVWQSGAILLPVKSVGVMGDERTYEQVVALRCVHSVDGMTADWVHLPYELLAKISNEIINKVKGINRVVYDISSKPPATIEWE
jgi:hypothetical protein